MTQPKDGALTRALKALEMCLNDLWAEDSEAFEGQYEDEIEAHTDLKAFIEGVDREELRCYPCEAVRHVLSVLEESEDGH